MFGLSPLASFYHLFQVYYKVRQVLLQSATPFFITKCDGLLLQSATAFLLQSATGITKCDNFITKCDRYYKVRRLLQSATVHCSARFLSVRETPAHYSFIRKQQQEQNTHARYW